MTADARSLDRISVVPRAGATLSNDPDWRAPGKVRDDDPELARMASSVTPDEMTEFLLEEHHRLYGRPWAMGRSYCDYLVGRRLGKGDRVLEFGCGAGRLGHLLIPELDVGAYVGIDRHLLALKAFAAYEIPLHGLEDRAPILTWGGLETLTYLQPSYSVVLDLFSSTHLDPTTELPQFLQHVRRLLAPNGRWISLAAGSHVAETALAAGFRISHKQVQEVPLLWPLTKKKRLNSWIEYVSAT